jgi:hypothetical protein
MYVLHFHGRISQSVITKARRSRVRMNKFIHSKNHGLRGSARVGVDEEKRKKEENE